MSSEKETILALQDRVNEYESLIKEMLEKSTNVAVVTAGPEIHDSNYFYRVRTSNGSEKVLVSKVREHFEKETEVVISESFIAKSIPKALINVKKPTLFKHINWSEVGGLKSQIEDIRKQVELPIKNAKLFKEFGIEPSKGILLYGPPGCGKTLISRVIASSIIGESGLAEDFIYLKGPELLSGLVGDTEEKIRKIFSDSRKRMMNSGVRVVIFIDEAESLLSRRGSGISSDMNSTIVPQFLAEMDGFDEFSPFILLSTNLPHSLDPAIIREGRIDMKVEIKRPTREDAVEIFQIHLRKVKLCDDISSLAVLGSKVLYESGAVVSGSMIKTIVNSAAQEALFRFSESGKMKGITESDLVTSIEKIVKSQI